MNKTQANKRNKRRLASKQKKKQRNIDKVKAAQARTKKKAKLGQFLSDSVQKKTTPKE